MALVLVVQSMLYSNTDVSTMAHMNAVMRVFRTYDIRCDGQRYRLACDLRRDSEIFKPRTYDFYDAANH